MSKSIYEFKKWDIVTRIEPAKPVGEDLFGRERTGDRSWIGTPMKYLGILNGCIYLQPQYPEDWTDEDRMIDLPLDIWTEGWDLYVNPKLLLEDIDDIIASDAELRKQIELAIADENFELAEKLSKKLKNI